MKQARKDYLLSREVNPLTWGTSLTDAEDHEWGEYERRVQAYEDQGMTRSDAQGVVEAEDMQ